MKVADGLTESADFVYHVLYQVCGFDSSTGTWYRGSRVGPEWGRPALTGETIKPRMLWITTGDSRLPVFLEKEASVGARRWVKACSRVLQWLRKGDESLALLTNGRRWRLIYAGLDFDAWCEWDAALWFEEGELSPQVEALRTLIQPALWRRTGTDKVTPLLDAVQRSRKGQAELSKVLGERVREAVEGLIDGHGEAFKAQCSDVSSVDIYRAAVRVVMRLVVTLFAESRGLLPTDNALYHGAYGLKGLLEDLETASARGKGRLKASISAWPRLLALFRLIHQGSHHPELPVPAYGGELFAPGDPASRDGMSRALSVLEGACFQQEYPALNDAALLEILHLLTRTRIKLRQGRGSRWVPAPVDFSDLSSEYIGILYEGLLDFELKTAPEDDPILFLAIGDQPALPLSRLESMEDPALKELFEKMKESSSAEESADSDSDESEAPSTESDEEEDVVEEDAEDENLEEDPQDARQAVRQRAEAWARRAVQAAGLMPRLRGKSTPEKLAAHEEKLNRKARQLIVRTVLPGEWYLARWGGTRKGSGSFYTRPGLAVPTVRRTLEPLLYDHSSQKETAKPRLPEEILALKVVDPACGSGTFTVAALRQITEALYESLIIHERITSEEDRSLVALLLGGHKGDERRQQELLPCLPDDELFEPRLKAVLRRHVVERCIYGVDLDPIAVELCRLALWVETMDRSLPFSFLDHKIKCGNGLVGAWVDQFEHYPVMAWKNREGGDKGHSNGVHFDNGEGTKLIKEWVRSTLVPDLISMYSGQLQLGEDSGRDTLVSQAALRTKVDELHEIPIQEAAERARVFHEEVEASGYYLETKSAMDLWCACWFWPLDHLDLAPLPSSFHTPSAETLGLAQSIATKRQFFHWELEFPDVFHSSGSGFDAVLGNPPWETLQPNSKEFFSNIDPLYRAYGKQEALRVQTTLFSNVETEEEWITYNASFADDSNWMKHVGNPFGDPVRTDKSTERFSFGRGRKKEEAYVNWRRSLVGREGFADPHHPFIHRGSGKAYTYKLFLEQAHALLKTGGRMGFIVPAGLYSDHGTGALRELFLDRCQWEWLFSFENREGIFDIHRSFKFNPVIVEKGGSTQSIQTAFMRRSLEDWEQGEDHATPYAREQVEQFSPHTKAILEIQSARDLEILEKIYANSVLLGDEGPDSWGIQYAQGDFNMTSDFRLFPPRTTWEKKGYRPDEYSRWLKGAWRPIEELWEELGVDPINPVPLDPACEKHLRDADVIRGEHRLRVAQPPYDRIPVPRADIPAGIILSREADAFIREDEIEGTALPLYEGRMIGQFDFSEKGWVSGKGRGAVWNDVPQSNNTIDPQYLMSNIHCSNSTILGLKIPLMNIGSSINTRTLICSLVNDLPCNHSFICDKN